MYPANLHMLNRQCYLHPSYDLDVSVVTPTADSHMSSYDKSLATAERAAQRKIEHYKQIANDNSAQFIPFIVETSGELA